MAHVALRATTNDFNVSTPDLIFQNKTSHLYATLEAGAIAEEKLFKIRVDWFETAKSGCNLTYCETYLKKLLTNHDVDFDYVEARVVLNKKIHLFIPCISQINKNVLFLIKVFI